MAQVHVDCNFYIKKFIQEEDIAHTILQYIVKSPDIDVLVETIIQSRITQEPFNELHQFRDRCFQCFSVMQKSKLRLNDLLHLYMAAYQPNAVWKTIWKSIFPVLSIQIIKDVEAFVSQTEFNHSQIMQIVFNL